MEGSIGENAEAIRRFANRLLKSGTAYTKRDAREDDTLSYMLDGDVSLMNTGITFSEMFQMLRQRMESGAPKSEVGEIAEGILAMKSRRKVFW